MAVLDKERPRGLRVPSLSAIKAFNRNKTADSPPPKELALPPIQLPAPSSLSLQLDAIPVRPPRPLEKDLPPNPLPSPPPQPQPQSQLQSQSPVAPHAAHQTLPLPPPPPPPPPSSVSKPRPDVAVNSPIRNTPPPRHIPRHPPAPVPAQNFTPVPVTKSIPNRPIPRAAPPQHQHQHQHQRQYQQREQPPPPSQPPLVSPVAIQQRTPPSSEGEPEQRHSNGTEDSLEGFIPEPEPELESSGSGPNEAGSSEEDDNRPWTPPEIEPVPVPLTSMHYHCYQDHRAMHKANNVWYALPCMTCQKFDREMRRRCVFCCLRVCVDCFQKLQKCPNRSLSQLMDTLSKPDQPIDDIVERPSASTSPVIDGPATEEQPTTVVVAATA